MGKNKKPPIRSRPAVVSTQLPIGKVQATALQTASLLGEPPPEWSAETIKALGEALPDDKKLQLSGFMEQFAEWGARLQSSAAAFEKLKADVSRDHEAQLAELARQRAAFDEKCEAHHQEIVERKRQWQEQEHQLQTQQQQAQEISSQVQAEKALFTSKQLAFIERETALTLREAELRNGLVLEREASLKMLREQVTALEDQRNRTARDIETKRHQLLQAAAQDAERIRISAQSFADGIRQREAELEHRITDNIQREERIKRDEALLRANRKSFAEHVQDAIKQERQQFETKLGKLEKRLIERSEENDRLQQELDALEDLRQSAGADPRQLLIELEELRRDNRAKDRELADLRSRAERDDPTELRQLRDRLQQQLDAQQSELAALRAKESTWQRSVTERQDWEKTRLVMEKGRTLLHSETERLRLQVDDLMSRQQAAAIFPALKAMDADPKLQIRTHTDTVSTLAHLVKDLQARLYWATPGKPLFFQEDVLQLFLGGLAMSQLHVFQGISGTGKTSLATAFAKAIGGEITTVAVQAGWRDRADLLGYYNAFEKRFYERNTLQALYRAQTEADKDRVHIVLLDEMNLSRPEQYFADFLSAMEMDGEQRRIDLMDSAVGSDHPKLLTEGKSIKLPDNVWFIGTANQDETTHGFADKTHDRAFVLDLPRWESTDKNPTRPKKGTTLSFSSLTAQFDAVCEKFSPQVDDLMGFINASKLTKTLADDFKLGWGNRLERQLKRFVPVVIEAGGNEALAVDYLLQSRMFRDGKVVGRHNVQVDDLNRIQDDLQEMWNDCELEGEPTRCLKAIALDINRLERGG
jgi:hypothetical protein